MLPLQGIGAGAQEHAHQRQHAAVRKAVGTQLAMTGVDPANVVAQLILQERAGIRAVRTNEAEMGQIGQDIVGRRLPARWGACSPAPRSSAP